LPVKYRPCDPFEAFVQFTGFQNVVSVPKEVENAIASRYVLKRSHEFVLGVVMLVALLFFFLLLIVHKKPRINFGGCDIVPEWDQHESNDHAKGSVRTPKCSKNIHDAQSFPFSTDMFFCQEEVEVSDDMLIRPILSLRLPNIRRSFFKLKERLLGVRVYNSNQVVIEFNLVLQDFEFQALNHCIGFSC
jgi:hypothetical protein